jgi:pilus assembly protein CpaE
MKIKVLHQNSARFEVIRQALAVMARPTDVSGDVYAIDTLPALLNDIHSDILIVDGATNACLDAVASLTLRAPSVETLLISGDTSADFLMRAMRAGVREVIPTLGGPELLQAALARTTHKRSNRSLAPVVEGKVLAFLSCKGGSGATFLATNLTYVLASEFGKRVALIDLNLQFGDAAMFVSDARPPSNVAELSQQIHRLDASLLAASMLEASPGFHVLAAPEDPARSTDVAREHVDAIIRLARQHYDFVILDVSRSLDAVSLQALDMADTIFPVLQLTLPFVRDGKRLLSIFRSLDYPRAKIQLVVNRHEEGGELSLHDLEKAIDEKVAHVVPNSYTAAAASVNLGIPIARGSRNNPISKLLVRMARELVPAAQAAEEGRADSRGWLSRVLSR